MFGEFRVSGASVLRVMEGGGGVVSFCIPIVFFSGVFSLLRSGFRWWGARLRVALMFSVLCELSSVCSLRVVLS